MKFTAWKVTGKRDLEGGGTEELTSMALGGTEETARLNWQRSQLAIGLEDPGRTLWDDSELVFEELPEVRA